MSTHITRLVFLFSYSQKWKTVEAEFNELVLESKNNVKSLEWLQPFWSPLYTCTPTENCEPIDRLVSAVRDVYKNSSNYNKSECVTSFLVKTTNELVIACRLYLNNNGKLEVLKQEPSVIIKKISVSALVAKIPPPCIVNIK